MVRELPPPGYQRDHGVSAPVRRIGPAHAVRKTSDLRSRESGAALDPHEEDRVGAERDGGRLAGASLGGARGRRAHDERADPQAHQGDRKTARLPEGRQGAVVTREGCNEKREEQERQVAAPTEEQVSRGGELFENCHGSKLYYIGTYEALWAVDVCLVPICGRRQKSIVETRCTHPIVQYGAHDLGASNSRLMCSTVYDSSGTAG